MFIGKAFMAKKSTTTRPRREAKYFDLEDLSIGAAWMVYKKKRGFYLWDGESGGSQRTLRDNIWSP
jgi:hypothetical protein